jgi:hypothetical protein
VCAELRGRLSSLAFLSASPLLRSLNLFEVVRLDDAGLIAALAAVGSSLQEMMVNGSPLVTAATLRAIAADAAGAERASEGKDKGELKTPAGAEAAAAAAAAGQESKQAVQAEAAAAGSTLPRVSLPLLKSLCISWCGMQKADFTRELCTQVVLACPSLATWQLRGVDETIAAALSDEFDARGLEMFS